MDVTVMIRNDTQQQHKRDKIDTTNMTWLNNYIKQTQSLSPAGRGERLEQEQELSTMHEECALEGQTELIELDGRRDGPVCHGTTSAGSLLEDACNVVKKFMERDPENLHFSLIALTELQD
ncbi:Ubiquitin carboxyl-terminal hydrolase isozyme L3 [Sparganum proliferum]